MEAFFKSCYDFRWLLSRKDSSLWRALGHLAVLGLVLTAARVAVYAPLSAQMIDGGAEFVRKEMPEVRVDKGVASVDAPQPWSKDFSGRFSVVLDASGKTQAADLTTPTGLLVTRDRVYFKRGPDSVQPFDLKPVQAFSTKGPQMDQLVAELKTWIYPVLAPLFLLFSFAGLALRWLLTAALATAAAEALGAPLDWGALIRIGAYALTPAAYFVLFGTLTGWQVLLVPTLASLFFLGVPLYLSKNPEAGEASDGPPGPDVDPENRNDDF